MKTRHQFWLATLLSSLAICGQAHADYHDQTIDTSSLAFAQYDTLTRSAGPYPFSNFGVGANVEIATDVSAGVSGSTTFDFPTIAAGQVFTANASSLNYAYTPAWSGGSVGAHTGLSASSSFSYDIGPFSGNYSIFDTALNTHANGNIGGGATLTGGSAADFVTGPNHNFGLTESALFASASAGVNVGLNLSSSVSFAPTVQYGYYSWINTTGTLSASDSLVWHGVSSGALDYNFVPNLAVQAGSENFFVNFLPAVQLQIAISPTATMTLPLTGYLDVSAFGDTLASATLALGNLYSLADNGDTWNDDVNFNGQGYYSLDLHEDNSQCQFKPGPTCETYEVLGGSPLTDQTLLPPNTTQNTTVGDTGGFNPGVNNAPAVPDACDPATGICYASTDPSMPIGPGTVTVTNFAGVPEPASWTFLGLGFGALGWAVRFRRTRLLVA